MAAIPTQVLVCPNCKAKTQFGFGPAAENAPNASLVAIGRCTVCQVAVFAYANRDGQVHQHWPPPTAWVPGEAAGVPDPIWADYSEASVSRSVHAFKATAVLCRRAVQGVAIDKGVKRRATPQTQIDAMEKRRLVTPVLKDAAHQIRVFGAAGAHPGKDGLDAVTEEEADAALQFMEELLDHIYRLPERLKKFQQAPQAGAGGSGES